MPRGLIGPGQPQAVFSLDLLTSGGIMILMVEKSKSLSLNSVNTLEGERDD